MRKKPVDAKKLTIHASNPSNCAKLPQDILHDPGSPPLLRDSGCFIEQERDECLVMFDVQRR